LQCQSGILAGSTLSVNSAGATQGRGFLALTEEDWQDGFALNFHGYVRMTRAAWPHLRESTGRIVNIVGVGSPAGSAEFTTGGSVDAAFECTKAMAHNAIPLGVGVSAINSRLIETDRFSRNVERVMRDRGLSRDEALTFLVSLHRTTGLGRPEEIRCLVAYLASGRRAFAADTSAASNRAPRDHCLADRKCGSTLSVSRLGGTTAGASRI
jgi:NAD(P)-dependent dehydrogenase (short-subunit alcohol dehydrogenase family)